jgi:hypothetical protein
MTDESNTLASAGTDFVQPEQNDTVPDYVFFDPDEDTDEAAGQGATDDDGQAATEDPATESAEPETDEADENEPATAAEFIELPDGTKIERDEVVKGYLRQADYTRKTTEVATRQKTLEAEATRISGITEAFIDRLSKLIPPAPGQDLAYRDPAAYTRAKAAHDAAVSQVQEIIKVGEQAKQAQQAVSGVEQQRIVADENAKLAQRFPETATPKGRQAFFAQAAEAAQAAGFGLDELQGVTDHRMFALAHLASLGMKAQQAQAKAKEKAAKAPPATPNKPGNAAMSQAARNREAMKRLTQSGSIRDALRVEFD